MTIHRLLDVGDAYQNKGDIDCSANPDFPAADNGHVYRVTVAGKIGGASGRDVAVKDLLQCNVDGSASGDQATVGANWSIVPDKNPDAVSGPASSTDDDLAAFDGASGKLIKSGGAVSRSAVASIISGAAPKPAVTVAGALSVTSEVTPAQITADQNDYNPGLSGNAVLRLSSDDNRTVTGMTGGGAGVVAIVQNVGAFTLSFPAEDANSTAANRFATTLSLPAGGAALFQYDNTVSRWRIISGSNGVENLLGWVDASEYPTIQAAVDANAGKKIYIPPGVYALGGTALTIDDAGTEIMGAGIFETVIQQSDAAGVIFQPPDPVNDSFINSVAISNLTIQYTSGGTEATKIGLQMIKTNLARVDNIIITGFHHGMRVARANASKFTKFHIASGIDAPTTAGSASLILDGAPHTGSTFQRTIASTFSDFYINAGAGYADANTVNYCIKFLCGDGIVFSDAYIAGGLNGILIQPENNLSFTGINMFKGIYHDGVNDTNNGVVIDPPSSGTGVIGSLEFIGCIFANYNDATESVAFRCRAPVGRLVLDSATRLSGADVGFEFTGDDGGSIIKNDAHIAGCAIPIRMGAPQIGHGEMTLTSATSLELLGGGLAGPLLIRTSDADSYPAALSVDIHANGYPAGFTEFTWESGIFQMPSVSTSFELLDLGDRFYGDILAHLCVVDGSSQNAVEYGRIEWDGTEMRYARGLRESEGNCVISSSAPFGHDDVNLKLLVRVSNSSGGVVNNCRLQVKFKGVWRKKT